MLLFQKLRNVLILFGFVILLAGKRVRCPSIRQVLIRNRFLGVNFWHRSFWVFPPLLPIGLIFLVSLFFIHFQALSQKRRNARYMLILSTLFELRYILHKMEVFFLQRPSNFGILVRFSIIR